MPTDETFVFVEFIGPVDRDGKPYFVFRTEDGREIGIWIEQDPLEQFAYILSDI